MRHKWRMIALSVVILWLLQALLMPKYMLENREGALISEYYDLAGNNDVIFVGDCEVYETFVPAILWEEYGIKSYVRGSAQQLPWQSYYMLEDVFKHEKPRAVVFNVYSLKYGKPQSEEFNRMTLDGMKWSGAKWNAIKASMTEEENMLDYIFPILRYHSRITELNSDDLRYIFKKTPAVSDGGYLMQTGIAPMTFDQSELVRGLSDYTLPKTAMEYLDKMRELCYAPEFVSYSLSEPNVLLLDKARYALDGEDFEETEEILRLDNKLRTRLGLPLRV